MKNLSLFVTLGFIALVGVGNPANADNPSSEDLTNNIELDGSTLEIQVEDAMPLVDGGSLEDTTIGAEEDAEIEASEINADANGDVILPATDSAEIPTEEESAEVVDTAE
ncbi:MAG: hypothetical protein AAGA80_22735 [Cyanobacteria bacterium P01_F01_bin.143]